jgi:hypothetical protein
VSTFDFTTPPQQVQVAPTQQTLPLSDYEKALNVSAWMGRIVAVCLVLAVIVGLVSWLRRNPKRQPPIT